MCEKRASFELARKPTGSEYKMLTGGIYAMLPLPVEQVQYLSVPTQSRVPRRAPRKAGYVLYAR